MKVAYRKSFARDLRKIRDEKTLQRICLALEQVKAASSLQEIAHLSKISGTSGFYRIRIGDYRLGIAVDGDEVEFVRCMNQREIYRHFP